MTRPRLLGFTLLEVMIAVVILAVGLSSLFTSEAGAMRVAQRARTTTIATLLARCKMGEIEERIGKEGWPGELIEDRDECCEEGDRDGYRCEWKVERIKLPEIDEDKEDGDDKDDDDKEGDGKKESKPGVIDQLAELSAKNPEERMGSITDLLSGDPDKGFGSSKREKGEKGGDDDDKDEESEAESELDPIAAMVMEMAFPIMKPVMEEGVRRASVKVKWKEGDREQELEVVQFLVTEQQLILPEGEDDAGLGTPTGGGLTTPTGTSTNAPTNAPTVPSVRGGTK